MELESLIWHFNEDHPSLFIFTRNDLKRRSESGCFHSSRQWQDNRFGLVFSPAKMHLVAPYQAGKQGFHVPSELNLPKLTRGPEQIIWLLKKKPEQRSSPVGQRAQEKQQQQQSRKQSRASGCVHRRPSGQPRARLRAARTLTTRPGLSAAWAAPTARAMQTAFLSLWDEWPIFREFKQLLLRFHLLSHGLFVPLAELRITQQLPSPATHCLRRRSAGVRRYDRIPGKVCCGCAARRGPKFF